ncbi:ATP-dependent Clp protease proteolytic subunit [Halalkalibacter oceani]|uniref:ATP-dependent Clp protease proteolytic subunit n=1 Tax=Halalkalibacter oceani TaxID=1653776 RepID=UPI003392C193
MIEIKTNNENNIHDIIEKDLFNERIININDDVSSYILDDYIPLIQRINLEDDNNGINPEDRKPIKIYVNSYGGSVYDGWSLISHIVSSKTPVWTYCYGYCMSMGLSIFAAGHRRFMSKYATLMYHELSSRLEGSREEIKRQSEEFDRLQKVYDEFLIERSKLDQDTLIKHQKNVNDWYIDHDTAIELEIATDSI